MAYGSVADWQKANPNSTISEQDKKLLESDPEFTKTFLQSKYQWDTGDANAKAQANANLNSARESGGSYSGGLDGVTNTYYNKSSGSNSIWGTLGEQLKSETTDQIRQGYSAAQDAIRKQQENARYQAQKQKEGITSGYYAGLSALNENAANNGFSSLGGQSRSERANALSEMTHARNEIDTSLQNAIAQYDAQIGQLLMEGKIAEATQAYNNRQLLLNEEQRLFENNMARESFDWQKSQDLFNNGLAEGQLLGSYKGQDTLAIKQLIEQARQFDKNFDENVRQFGITTALQKASIAAGRSSGGGGGSTTETYHGMTRDQVQGYYMDAYKNGMEIPAYIQEAYDYFFNGAGTGIGSTTAGQAGSIDREIGAAYNSGADRHTLTEQLDYYVAQGVISFEDAKMIAGKYGLVKRR